LTFSAGFPSGSSTLSVDPRDFARQMSWLKREGYRTISQRELFEAHAGGADVVALDARPPGDRVAAGGRGPPAERIEVRKARNAR